MVEVQMETSIIISEHIVWWESMFKGNHIEDHHSSRKGIWNDLIQTCAYKIA